MISDGLRTPVRVFIDREWLSTEKRLLPMARYLFGQKEHALPTFRDEFVHNMEFRDIVLSEAAESCDFMYLPVNYSVDLANQFPKLIERMEKSSIKFGKNIMVEEYSKDITKPEAVNLPFTKGMYLNYSLIRSLAPSNFHSIPYFIPDCLDHYFSGRFTPHEVRQIPTVGFCGVAAPIRTKWNVTKIFDSLRLALSVTDDLWLDSEVIARRMGTNMKHAHRTKALLFLSLSKRVKTDFVFRAEGGLVNNNYTNLDDLDPYNTEFYKNMHRNLYSLCSRGTENYSVRLFETFCMGRVPVLIDTDIALPFESRIDYEKHCVLVSKRNLRKIDRVLVAFHSSRGGRELVELQEANRELWQTYFSHKSFWHQWAKSISI